MSENILPILIFAALVPAQDRDCSEATMSCLHMECRLSIGLSPADTMPWHSSCLEPGALDAQAFPVDARSRNVNVRLQSEPDESLLVEVTPPPRSAPLLATAQVSENPGWRASSSLGRQPVLAWTRMFGSRMQFTHALEWNPFSMQSVLAWQPLRIPWTHALVVETKPQYDGWHGTRIGLRSTGLLALGRFEGMLGVEALSHSANFPQPGLRMGPEVRVQAHVAFLLGRWVPGLGIGVDAGSARHGDAWQRPVARLPWIADLRLEPAQAWTVQLAVDGEVWQGFQSLDLRVAAEWTLISVLTIERHPKSHGNASHARVMAAHAAWVADVETSPASRWSERLSANDSSKRLPTLSEWQEWFQRQLLLHPSETCPVGSDEWVLPNHGTGIRIIRTGLKENGNICAQYPEDWEAIDPASNEIAKVRWWRLIQETQ